MSKGVWHLGGQVHNSTEPHIILHGSHTKTSNKGTSFMVLAMFTSIYACEKSFSHMKNIKTNLRLHLNDESLKACMKFLLTEYEPD